MDQQMRLGSGQPRSLPVPNRLLTLVLLLSGCAVIYAALVVHVTEGPVILAMVGAGLVVAGAAAGVLRFWQRQQGHQVEQAFQVMFGHVADPVLLTDLAGRIVGANASVRLRQELHRRQSIEDGLRPWCRAPETVVHALARRAVAGGVAGAVLDPESGGFTHLTASMIGDNRLVWRIHQAESPEPDSGPDYHGAPFLQVIADAQGRILRMNRHIETPSGEPPQTLEMLVADGPVRPGGIHALSHRPEEAVRCQERALADGGRELFFFPAAADETHGLAPDRFLDHLPVGLARLTLSGEIIFANRAARALLGDRAQPGTLLGEVVEGLGRSIPDRLMEVSRGRSIGRSEIARSHGEERDLFLQVSLNRLVIDGDISVIAVISDATEMKTLEAQFVQSQKMQAIGQLAGGIAHDFNNLLTAINGHCDLLLLRHEAGDGDHGDLLQVRQNSHRAAGLVRQLLAFSRKQTLRPKVLHLVETLSDLAHLLNRLLGERVTLRIEHGSDLGPVKVDERQFEQVIMNLVVNARDAMPNGGEVCISTRNLSLRHDVERDRAIISAGEYVLIEVADTGIGIPDDKLNKIFEPFYTTKKLGEGTGLGLSTAYGIVKQTGGFIFASSILGRGSTFSIYLPRHENEDAVELVEVPVEEPVRDLTGKGVVLLVEDEAPVRSFAARALRLRGYTVLEAGSGEEALEISGDASQTIDILVSDVVMPGIDGPAWVREARRTRPDVKVIFVSGYAEDVFKTDGGSAMEDAVFVPKPFSLNDLTQKVKEVLEAR